MLWFYKRCPNLWKKWLKIDFEFWIKKNICRAFLKVKITLKKGFCFAFLIQSSLLSRSELHFVVQAKILKQKQTKKLGGQTSVASFSSFSTGTILFWHFQPSDPMMKDPAEKCSLTSQGCWTGPAGRRSRFPPLPPRHQPLKALLCRLATRLLLVLYSFHFSLRYTLQINDRLALLVQKSCPTLFLSPEIRWRSPAWVL